VRQVLGVSSEEYQAFLLDESAEVIASFDELVQEMTSLPSAARTPEEQFMARRSLEQALSALDEREQRVVQMYYEFELSYKEIAAVLDLTDARVCQLNKGALRKMKTFLQAA
jgi:RNA polymerase sigma factor for flagellar operon FliA